MLARFRPEDILKELDVAERIAKQYALQTSYKVVKTWPDDVVDMRFAGQNNEFTPKGKRASEYANRCDEAAKLVDKLKERGLTTIELPSADLDLKELEAFLREAFSQKVAQHLPEAPT